MRDISSKKGIKTTETEIDILAVSSQNKKYFIGECKYKNTPFTYSEYLDTLAKMTPQKEKAEFYYALFSASGFDRKIHQEAMGNSHLYLCTLDEIVHQKPLNRQ